ncbi:hypothetical protein [Breoghania sp. L-A4]|uniref:hypothetical protein n=1 Tax=Breoghania sp. L-A4 TaxID=2304600 RepID=UPI000E35959A|nr:hypothetical protein [Breoghania sp. L-A4]AXS41421.1 hypothetical protein D1F64_17150 [Breoghania sp. L-A4]
MKTALVVMTLLGCDCTAQQCEYVRTVDGPWTSVEACQAAMARQIAGQAETLFPAMTAICAHAIPGDGLTIRVDGTPTRGSERWMATAYATREDTPHATMQDAAPGLLARLTSLRPFGESIAWKSGDFGYGVVRGRLIQVLEGAVSVTRSTTQWMRIAGLGE